MARFITADHPVVVVRSRAEQTIPAGHLKIGDSVICGNGPQVLTEATPFLSDTDVFKITFEPDVVINRVSTWPVRQPKSIGNVDTYYKG